MREEAFRVFGYIAFGLVIALGALAVVHMIISLPIPEGKGPEWTGAIGTVGALIGTIWLATTESRRRAHEEIQKANLRAASFHLRIASAAGYVGAVSEIFATNENPFSAQHFNWAREKLLEIDLWTPDELMPLVPLGNRLAISLAQSADQVHAAIVAAAAGAIEQSEAQRGNIARHIVGLICELEEKFDFARKICVSAMNDGAE